MPSVAHTRTDWQPLTAPATGAEPSTDWWLRHAGARAASRARWTTSKSAKSTGPTRTSRTKASSSSSSRPKGHEISQLIAAALLSHPHDGATVYYRSRPLMLGVGLSPFEAFASVMHKLDGRVRRARHRRGLQPPAARGRDRAARVGRCGRAVYARRRAGRRRSQYRAIGTRADRVRGRDRPGPRRRRRHLDQRLLERPEYRRAPPPALRHADRGQPVRPVRALALPDRRAPRLSRTSRRFAASTSNRSRAAISPRSTPRSRGASAGRGRAARNWSTCACPG